MEDETRESGGGGKGSPFFEKTQSKGPILKNQKGKGGQKVMGGQWGQGASANVGMRQTEGKEGWLLHWESPEKQKGQKNSSSKANCPKKTKKCRARRFQGVRREEYQKKSLLCVERVKKPTSSQLPISDRQPRRKKKILYQLKEKEAESALRIP